MKTLIVKNISKNEKLSNYIKNNFPNVSNSAIHKALRKKDIKINGKRINSDTFLNNNDIIEIYITDNILYNIPNNIKRVYEDENIVVFFKPQGLLTNNEVDEEPSLESLVKLEYKEITLCHRLDRNTAGLVIFAKNQTTSQGMFDAFKNGYINKNYLAFVANSNFTKENEKLEQYLLKDTNTQTSKVVTKKTKDSKKIITEYKVIKKYKDLDYAILNIKIHTGKTHQIRAVMSYISHPIIGDSKYGKNEINKKFKVFRQLLFAYKYSFNFPSNYSKLNYLNDIIIKLDEKTIKDCIGSDIIGK